MTSKQRAYLRSLAVELDTILYVGKSGLGAQLFKEADAALQKRELIKGRILPDTCPETPRDAAEAIAGATRSQVVQVIGRRLLLYRKNPKKPVIVLD